MAALAVLLFFVSYPIGLTQANEDDFIIPMTFDAAPWQGVIEDGSDHYIVKYYKGRKDDQGDLVTLVNEGAAKVTAVPGKYYADGSEVLVAATYDEEQKKYVEDGSGPTYHGRIRFNIEGRSLTAYIPESDLTKEYGDDSRSVIEWRQGSGANEIIVNFESEGMAASAPIIAEGYPLTVKSVTSGGNDVTHEYTVTPKKQGTTNEDARLIVTKKSLTVSFASEQSVAFNNFRFSKEDESVASVEKEGVNEETVIAYFRLTETDRDKNVLTIGDHYAVEYFKHSVLDGAGLPVEDDNYTITADLASVSTVIAVSGPITLYQSETLEDKEKYTDRTDCVESSLSDFTFTYLDDLVSDYKGAILFRDVELYPGIVVDLSCSIVCDEGDVPYGTYKLTLLGVEQDGEKKEGFDDLTLDKDFSMEVKPYVLKYSGTDECQYGYKTFKKELKLSIPGREGEYTFSLAATIGENVPVGNDETRYTDADENLALSKEDANNVRLDYSGAKIRIVQRRDGVSFRAADDLSRVLYRSDYAVCTLTLAADDKIDTLATLSFLANGDATTTEILYSYSTNGGETYTTGRPTVVGTYKVKCAVKNTSSYAAEEAIFDLTIIPRPVLVLYRVASTEKKYGDTFRFATDTMKLDKIYAYDAEREKEDRDTVYNETLSVFSAITCAGAAASAELGAYDVTISIVTGNFDVMSILLYDIGADRESSTITVVKGDRPPNTTVTAEYSGRAITVRAGAGPALLQIAKKSDFSDRSEYTSQEGVTSFNNREYGQIYYVRACITDAAHYTKDGEWSDVQTIAIPFPALTVKLTEDSVTDTQAVFTATALDHAVDYVVQYRIGSSGSWKDGLTVQGLAPGATQTVHFRAKAGSVVGQESSAPVTTLCSPVQEDAVSFEYDRETGALTVVTSAAVEMRLLNKEGEVVVDWTAENVFADVPRDAEYVLQVRNAADGERSVVMEIETDTYRKGPLSVLTYLSDWFLVWIGGVMIVALVVIVILFARVKKQMDSKLLGGKNGK